MMTVADNELRLKEKEKGQKLDGNIRFERREQEQCIEVIPRSSQGNVYWSKCTGTTLNI